MKGIILAISLTALFGCASAEQKIASKQDYRRAQVEAIKVQAEQRTARETADQLSEAAMWQSLAAAVQANPESASHFAIVMAVAASKGAGSLETPEAPMATVNVEREVTALDWAKVLTGPVLGTVTQVGIAALNTDLQKTISDNNREVDIIRENVEGKVFDVIGTMASNPRTSVTVTDSASYVGGDSSISTTTETTTSTTTTTTTTTDDDIYVINTDVSDADDQVDEVVEETQSFGLTEEDDEPVDCSEPQFSPIPEECWGL